MLGLFVRWSGERQRRAAAQIVEETIDSTRVKFESGAGPREGWLAAGVDVVPLPRPSFGFRNEANTFN